MGMQRVNGSVNGSGGAGAGAGVLLEWVAKYGLPTVFAVVLLVFVLWQSFVAQQEILASQREIARSLAEVARSVERLNARLEARPLATSPVG